MRLLPGLVLTLVGSLPGGVADAQGGLDEAIPPAHHFLGRTEVFTGIPRKDLGVEALFAPHFVIFENLTPGLPDNTAPDCETDRDFGHKGGKALMISLTPMVRARILTTYSAPVRIPSYMPRGSVQWFQINERKLESSTPRSRWEEWPGRVWMKSVVLTVGHHSNGQDGCTLSGLEQPDGRCREIQSADVATLPPNVTNGSFSTNYIQLGFFLKRMHLTNLRAETWWHVGVSYEANPGWLKMGGAVDPPLRRVYGTNRLRLEAAGETRRKSWRLRANPWVEHVFKDADVGSDRWKISLEASAIHYRTGAGLFVRYYSGQDYYNIHFFENLRRLQLGLILDPARVQQFRSPNYSCFAFPP